MMGEPNSLGIMPQALEDLFAQIEERSEEIQCSVFMSYLEIYNETIRDLLVDNSPALDLRVTANDCAVVAGLSQHRVHVASEVTLLTLRLLCLSSTQRHEIT